MRWVVVGLGVLLLWLQYRLWFADGGAGEALRLKEKIAVEREANAELEARNAVLEAQVIELQSGDAVIEQRAREDLGLIKDDEVYYQFPSEPESDW
jgi:cell division protein FtsB